MSRWRRRALDAFPERREWISRVPDLDEVLRLLAADVLAATSAGWHPVDGIVSRACDFAAWCFLPEQNASVRQAAADFYTKLMPFPETRPLVVAHLTLQTASAFWVIAQERLTVETLRDLRAALVQRYGLDAHTFPEPLSNER